MTFHASQSRTRPVGSPSSSVQTLVPMNGTLEVTSPWKRSALSVSLPLTLPPSLSLSLSRASTAEDRISDKVSHISSPREANRSRV